MTEINFPTEKGGVKATLMPFLARAVKSVSVRVQVRVWLAGLYTSYTESSVAVSRFDSSSSVWSLEIKSLYDPHESG